VAHLTAVNHGPVEGVFGVLCIPSVNELQEPDTPGLPVDQIEDLSRGGGRGEGGGLSCKYCPLACYTCQMICVLLEEAVHKISAWTSLEPPAFRHSPFTSSQHAENRRLVRACLVKATLDLTVIFTDEPLA